MPWWHGPPYFPNALGFKTTLRAMPLWIFFPVNFDGKLGRLVATAQPHSCCRISIPTSMSFYLQDKAHLSWQKHSMFLTKVAIRQICHELTGFPIGAGHFGNLWRPCCFGDAFLIYCLLFSHWCQITMASYTIEQHVQMIELYYQNYCSLVQILHTYDRRGGPSESILQH